MPTMAEYESSGGYARDAANASKLGGSIKLGSSSGGSSSSSTAGGTKTTTTPPAPGYRQLYSGRWYSDQYGLWTGKTPTPSTNTTTTPVVVQPSQTGALVGPANGGNTNMIMIGGGLLLLILLFK